MARDGYRCTWQAPDRATRCFAPATDVDHIIPAYRGGSDDDSNLASLCRRHHRSKTAREANEAKPKRKRPRPPHPGLKPSDGGADS